jgi:hypothetical protein
MAFEITDLNELDPELVQQTLDSTIQRLQELHPELDLKRGVFHDTVAYYHSVLEAAVRTNLARYLSARSLLEIEQDPTLADDEVVDSVLSLYRIERQQGTTAKGQITVVVSDNTTVSISAGTVWIANGREFVTETPFTAKSEPELINSSTDRLMVQLSDGNYGFLIDVVALEEGPESRLSKDTKVLPETLPLNYLTSYATEDFLDGTDTQTNDELLNDLQAGLAAKALSNRVNMRAALLEIEQFARIPDMSIVGYGDAEMLRDAHSIFPMSYGGRVDWYIRGDVELQRKVLIKDATLIEIQPDNCGIWQVAITKDDSPAFFELRNIRLTGVNAADVSGGFEITLEQRGLDLTGSGFIPDIETQEEGEYSRFQTSIVQFRDTVTDHSSLSVGATQQYEVEATGTPLIADVQDTVSSRDVRNHAADALVKAPIPCFVQVTFTINKKTNDEDPDLDGIRESIMDVVNRVSFTGRLDASQITDAVHAFLKNAMSITDMDLFGRIRRPDATMLYLRDPESLIVEDDPARMVTSKTVQFFLERENISIAVENAVPVPA